MWNPLHFAVYYQNMELVKFFITDLKVNIALTAPKSNADSEKDVVNTEKYPEDKIMLLLLALDRRNSAILQFLLNECYQFWPHSTIENIMVEQLNNEIKNHEGAENHPVWIKAISVVLKSKTAWSFYGALSPKKRREWLYNFVHDLDQL